MYNSVLEKVKSIVSEIIGISGVDEIGSDDDLLTLGLNSISFIKIVVTIENSFNITFDDEDLLFHNFNTLNKLTSYIQKKV